MSNICQCILQVEDEEADIFLLKGVFQKAGINSPVQAVVAPLQLVGLAMWPDPGKQPESNVGDEAGVLVEGCFKEAACLAQ